MWGRGKKSEPSSGGGAPDTRIEVEAVYQVYDNSLMSGELRQTVVKSDGITIGEVREALADKHETTAHKVDVVKWRQK